MGEILNYIQTHWETHLGILVLLSVFVDISPIHINPVKWILGWIGEQCNKDMKNKLNEMDGKIDELNKRQDTTEKRLDNMDLGSMRSKILDFANSTMHGRSHTQEEFNFILGLHKDYCDLIGTKNYNNGQLDEAISFIKEKYHECLESDGFLK